MMNEQMESLDNLTKAVCAAWFGMMEPRVGRLTFGMKEQRPSPEAQGALDRLVGAGVISRSDNEDGSVVYVPQIDCRELLGWFIENGDLPEYRIPLTEKIIPEAKEGFAMEFSSPSGLGEDGLELLKNAAHEITHNKKRGD